MGQATWPSRKSSPAPGSTMLGWVTVTGRSSWRRGSPSSPVAAGTDRSRLTLRRSPRSTRSIATPLLLAVVLALGACGADGSPTSPSEARAGEGPGEEARLRAAHAGVCDAAGAGPDRAETIFFDRAHDALHELARALQETDRPLAARLLAAKQDVEADFEAASRAASARADLVRLAAVTGDALDRLDIDTPDCGR